MFRKKILKKVLAQEGDNYMEMSEIKKSLEIKSISKKIDFIDEYNFENLSEEDYQYIVEFIGRESIIRQNEWFIIRLIDLAGEVQLKDNFLINKYLGYLESGCSYYLKLTVLDYVRYMFEFYKDDNINYNSILGLLTKRSERLTVKIQASLTLILIYPNEKAFYIKKIKEYIKRSEDYRTHIRLYNSIIYGNIDIPTVEINEYVEITERKDFSKTKAVQSVLIETKEYLSALS